MRTSKANKRRIFTMLIVTLILAIVFVLVGFRSKKTLKYYYIENNSIDYKVYLKDNNYFDLPYLEKNKTYITSLIDYINTDFNYNVDFNEAVSGDINYQLVAQISVDRENNEVGNYWTKEYELTKKKTDNIKGKKSHSILLSQNIKYNKYNETLRKFVSEYSLSAESTLKIYLKVNGKVKIDNTNEYLDIDSKISLDMPLSQLAIEGTINTDNKNNQKEITVEDPKCDLICFIFKAFFFIDLVMLCRYIYQYVECIKMNKKFMSYRKRIRKINNEYEDIITNVKDVNINNYTIIQVEEFDDLLNVYNNVREPINRKNGYEKTVYFVINHTTCYLYTISKEDYEK